MKKNEYNIPDEFSVPEEFSKLCEEGQYRRAEFGTEMKSEPRIDREPQEDGSFRRSGTSSEEKVSFGSRYRRMTKFAVTAAIIFLVYPMMDLDLFAPFSSAAPVLPPSGNTPLATESDPAETSVPGESGTAETAEPGESGTETTESHEATSSDEKKGGVQTLTVSGAPQIEAVNSDGGVRRQTDMEYRFLFKADKEIDTTPVDFNGEPDAYERALEYLASQGVDVSEFRLSDTEFVNFGEEESPDLIFVGDRDDPANAYVMQGTLTFHYGKTEIYQNFDD